jgi:hypothetical protein
MAQNTRLWNMIHSGLEQNISPEMLYAAIVRHEDEALDYIRLKAAEHGLFPAIVGKVLMETGLGSWLSPEEMTQLATQEAQQQATLAEMMRQLGGEL